MTWFLALDRQCLTIGLLALLRAWALKQFLLLLCLWSPRFQILVCYLSPLRTTGSPPETIDVSWGWNEWTKVISWLWWFWVLVVDVFWCVDLPANGCWSCCDDGTDGSKGTLVYCLLFISVACSCLGKNHNKIYFYFFVNKKLKPIKIKWHQSCTRYSTDTPPVHGLAIDVLRLAEGSHHVAKVSLSLCLIGIGGWELWRLMCVGGELWRWSIVFVVVWFWSECRKIKVRTTARIRDCKTFYPNAVIVYYKRSSGWTKATK